MKFVILVITSVPNKWNCVVWLGGAGGLVVPYDCDKGVTGDYERISLKYFRTSFHVLRYIKDWVI